MGIFSKPAAASTAVFDPVAFKAVLLKVVKAYSNNRSTVKRSIWITILVTIAIRIHGMVTSKPKKNDKRSGLSKGDGKVAKVAVRTVVVIRSQIYRSYEVDRIQHITTRILETELISLVDLHRFPQYRSIVSSLNVLCES